MKKLFYLLYSIFFNLSRVFPVKQNRVSLLAPHNAGSNDSLSAVRSYLDNVGGFDIVEISGNDLHIDRSCFFSMIRSCVKAASFFTVDAKALATSKYVFMNDNFMPMSQLHFSKKTVITQLWHAEGAFKKFGLACKLEDDIKKRELKSAEKLTYVICSSKSVAPIYAQAFGVDESKVIPLGSARTDMLTRYNDIAAMRKSFDSEHPECARKKLVLYAPTFRDDPKKDKILSESINTVDFSEKLGDEYALLVKLHPQLHSSNVPDGATNVTDTDINILTLICDILITDYSSVCMNFAMLSKPCIFYAFDLDEYENDRSFYFDYRNYVPGPVLTTFSDVLNEIKNPSNTEEQLRRFRDTNFDRIDSENTKRICEFVIERLG